MSGRLAGRSGHPAFSQQSIGVLVVVPTICYHTAIREIILITFDWVPEMPRGYVRDLRVRWPTCSALSTGSTA